MLCDGTHWPWIAFAYWRSTCVGALFFHSLLEQASGIFLNSSGFGFGLAHIRTFMSEAGIVPLWAFSIVFGMRGVSDPTRSSIRGLDEKVGLIWAKLV